MIEDFNESDCEKFDEGKLSDHSMIMICISKIRELITEVNYLRRAVK